MKTIDELELEHLTRFESDYLLAQRPVVIRGLVSHWPIVGEFEEAAEKFTQYASADYYPVVESPASADGRIGYSNDLTKFNFKRKMITFDKVRETLTALSRLATVKTFAVQSAYVDSYFSGLEQFLTQPLFGQSRPRIWLGNRTKVAAHFDDSDNLACVTTGRRKFTLYPPNQISNLYVGPIDNTPAGTPISIASQVAECDSHRLKEANNSAVWAELGPGDAVFIPTLWWHQVEALDDINVLVNFWSGGAVADDTQLASFDALLHALITIGQLPKSKREAWSAIFDHYVFGDQDLHHSHIPEQARGILNGVDNSQREVLAHYLIDKLSTAVKQAHDK